MNIGISAKTYSWNPSFFWFVLIEQYNSLFRYNLTQKRILNEIYPRIHTKYHFLLINISLLKAAISPHIPKAPTEKCHVSQPIFKKKEQKTKTWMKNGFTLLIYISLSFVISPSPTNILPTKSLISLKDRILSSTFDIWYIRHT